MLWFINQYIDITRLAVSNDWTPVAFRFQLGEVNETVCCIISHLIIVRHKFRPGKWQSRDILLWYIVSRINNNSLDIAKHNNTHEINIHSMYLFIPMKR